jgi:TrmH family RNA methyltransferase
MLIIKYLSLNKLSIFLLIGFYEHYTTQKAVIYLITSKQNSSFKLWKQLKLKKYRDAHDMFLVYGKHLVDKAKEKGALLEVLSSDASNSTIQLSKELMDELQQAETYFDLIGVCKKTNPIQYSNKVLMLDDVQDPDNLGALMRSAAAFGFMHLMMSHQSADAYNEKTIRASKGSLFDLYIERKPLVESIIKLKEQGFKIIYTDAHHQSEVHIGKKVVLVMGNEGHGVSDDVKHQSDDVISIPTQHVESLNVSVAGGILMYQWRDL